MDLFEILSERYPQLVFPIEEGISKSREFEDVCLRLAPTARKPHFNGTKHDRIEVADTPAGEVEVVYIYDRADFVHAYQALGYRCEPVKIPDSTGAVTLLGINNLLKVRALEKPFPFADKSEYQDTLILLSRGPYSNISGDVAGQDDDKWYDISNTIRKYHELTHVVSRRLFPENKDAIRDEIMADMIGIIFACGRYDTNLARLFLGIEKDGYRQGGRLQNYTDKDGLLNAIERSKELILLFEANIDKDELKDPFRILQKFEEQRLGL